MSTIIERERIKKIRLGNRVRDRVSQYSGIVTSICLYLSGGTSFFVEFAPDTAPEEQVAPEGFIAGATLITPSDTGRWIDENRCEFIDDGIAVPIILHGSGRQEGERIEIVTREPVEEIKGSLGTEALTSEAPFNAMSEPDNASAIREAKRAGREFDEKISIGCTCGAVLIENTAHDTNCDLYRPHFELGQLVFVSPETLARYRAEPLHPDAMLAVRNISDDGFVTMNVVNADSTPTNQYVRVKAEDVSATPPRDEMKCTTCGLTRLQHETYSVEHQFSLKKR